MAENDEELRVRLHSETSIIGWGELQRFYATGSIIAVSPGVDLLDVACCLAEDDKPQLEGYMTEGKVFRPDDSHALRWHEEDCALWAVVVAPWVLVQEEMDPAA